MATIKDIAREAGVSIGTVSAVLNGSTTIKAENMRKVNDAIKKFNYQINMAARTLKTGNSKTIGLIIPDISNPFYPELARGVEDAARQAGFTVFLCNNDRDVQKEKDYINALTSQNVDGIIMAKPQMTKDELYAVSKSCKLVFIDTRPELTQCFDTVNVDDRDGITQAMELLFKYGHRKIAYISGLMESNSAIQRFESYKESLHKHGIPFNNEYFQQKRYDWFSGYSATMDLLRLGDVPTAILSANDIIAFGSLKALREWDINVPLDMSVIGFDDIDQASYSCPPLTTIRQPKYEMGVASVEILLKKLECGEEPHLVQTFSTKTIVRETVNYAKSVIRKI